MNNNDKFANSNESAMTKATVYNKMALTILGVIDEVTRTATPTVGMKLKQTAIY